MALPEGIDAATVLEVIVDAAKQAGHIIREHAGVGKIAATKADAKDLVTEYDTAAQRTAEGIIKARLPACRILGEEDVPAGSAAAAAAIDEAAAAPLLAIIDPIDGTTNFVCGLPASVVSIGVAAKGVMLAAAVYDPHRDDMYTALAGAGAFVNGEPIHVAAATELSAAVLAFGTHHDTKVGVTMLKGVESLLDTTRGVRSFGTAALHLCWVARGWLTGFWELDLCVWDVCAGSLLVQEAGGKVTDTRGEPFSLRMRDTFASNGAPAVHDGVLASLARVGADRVPE